MDKLEMVLMAMKKGKRLLLCGKQKQIIVEVVDDDVKVKDINSEEISAVIFDEAESVPDGLLDLFPDGGPV